MRVEEFLDHPLSVSIIIMSVGWVALAFAMLIRAFALLLKALKKPWPEGRE